ncbi:hypothetical protein [Ferruginibacter profundus]
MALSNSNGESSFFDLLGRNKLLVRKTKGSVHHQVQTPFSPLSQPGKACLPACRFCSTAYVQFLQRHQAHVSMTQNGDPYENTPVSYRDRKSEWNFKAGTDQEVLRYD